MSKFEEWLSRQPGFEDGKHHSVKGDFNALKLPPEEIYKRLEAKALRVGVKNAEQAKELLLMMGNLAQSIKAVDIWATVEQLLDDGIAAAE
jgi:hypothetical protein